MVEDFDPSRIRALAFDLDGTLLRPDKSLSQRTLRALRACMDRGIRVIIVTGRSLDSGERYRREIGAPGPHVYYNGAEVADLSAGKIIQTRFIEARELLFCVRLARETGTYFQIFFSTRAADAFFREGESSGEILVADRITAEAELYQKNSGVLVIAGDLEEYIAKTPAAIKGLFISSEENLAKLRPMLEEHYGESLYLTRSSPTFLEILTAGVSKGTGLIHALEYLHLGREETIAFGDEENDIPMLETALFSAAPANAKKAVRDAAVFQIPSNAEDGVAAFLEERFGLDTNSF